ncbi:MAG: hypothetical protein K6U74_05215 [Firmicutes bacterium]|nr:hypothetical protein [Bacillota bacterium]
MAPLTDIQIPFTGDPNRRRCSRKVLRYLAASFMLLAALLWRFPAGVKFFGYGVVREIAKAQVIAGTWNMAKLTSEHFYIKYMPEDRAEAMLVLETAEKFHTPVTEDFGFFPRRKIPLILYSSREELNRSFGWEAKESAMGVYWAGAIRVLSPAAWVGEIDPKRAREVFISSGPMAHELTHLMVDYLTGGNYPRWFTEGVAQWEEYKLTGFQFNDAAGSLNQPLYSLKELTLDFDSLPNQSLAYRQSFAAVRYIVNFYGDDALLDLMKSLSKGHDFSEAMEKVLGLSPAAFEAKYQAWALKNGKMF